MLDEHMKYPKWQKPYLAALMEVKQAELSAKVEAAEAAVSQRTRELEPPLAISMNTLHSGTPRSACIC